MLKKVILGALLLGLTGVLIVGAVNRTAAKTADAETHQVGNQGQGRYAADGEQLVSNGQGRGRIAEAGLSQSNLRVDGQNLNQSEGRGQSQQDGGGQGQQDGGQGWRGGQDDPEDASVRGRGAGGNSQAEVQAWQTIEGLVTSIDDEQMSVMTEAGQVEVTGRSWRFAQEQGFAARIGDQVRVIGFDEDGDFEAGQIINLTSQQQVQMREESGRPAWAGGGGSTSAETGGYGQGAGESVDGVPYAETEDHQWETVSGTVVSVDAEQLVVAMADGELIITDRPWDFAQQAGFSAQPGDQLVLDGYYEDGTFEVGKFNNLTSGQETAIREDSGRPLWAGGANGGRGGGRGRSS